mmetsp:Transcript_13133/g.41016  ORF Transcript_13133/g.41016 Transcript_13133/m.41016 type:complete len:272 (+) Transcript_13133:153-968(+)
MLRSLEPCLQKVRRLEEENTCLRAQLASMTKSSQEQAKSLLQFPGSLDTEDVVSVPSFSGQEATPDRPGNAYGRLATSFPLAREALKSHDVVFLGTTSSLAELNGEELGPENVVYGIVFMVFIVITSITLMNMMVGVLVDIVNLTALYEREQLDIRFVKEYFVKLAKRIDVNGDDIISKAEFNELMHMPEALRALQGVGVDVVGLVDLASFMFRGMDSMRLPDFMDLVLQLRGSNKATVKDIVDTRKFLVQTLTLFEHRLVHLLGPQGQTV